MKPATDTLPKSLIPVHDKPFLHYQLAWLKRQGITDVVMSIGHLGEQIRAYAGDGSAWALPIRYVEEGSQLRGTGGALRLAADEEQLQNRFLVLYGDSFLPIDFGAVWQEFLKRSDPALMTVLKNEGLWDRSNVLFEDGRVVLYDKSAEGNLRARMRYIDYGLSALSRDLILQEIPPGIRTDLADLFHRLSVQGRLGGYKVSERFFEIGSPAGLADFAAYIQTHPLA